MSNSGNYIFKGQGLQPQTGYASAGYGAIPGGQSSLSDDIFHLGARGLTIRILPANGGIIISIRDENNPSMSGDLHVISHNQDIGEELGKIITMHYLKKE